MSSTKHFIEPGDLTKSEYLAIVARAEALESGQIPKIDTLCCGRTIAAAFFGSSVRTLALVHIAAAKLGASYVSINACPDEPAFDVVSSLADLAEVVVVRNNSLELGSIREKVSASLVNGLCRGEDHSLSGIWQIYSLQKLFGRLEGLTVGIYGQTRHCRPYLTLQKILGNFGAKIYHDPRILELANPPSVADAIRGSGGRYELCDLREVASEIDLLLVPDGLPMGTMEEETAPLFDRYCKRFETVTEEYLAPFSSNVRINYMMPRLLADGRLTVAPELDDDPRVYNSALMRDGVWSTMALFLDLLEIEP